MTSLKDDPGVQRLIDDCRRHAVAILLLDPVQGLDSPESIVGQGSGILVRSDERRFILTAKHVVDGYRNNGHVAALSAVSGQSPRVITNWSIIAESGTLDIATIDVPRGFDERDIGKEALRARFPLARAQRGEPCVLAGFPAIHRRIEPNAARLGLSPMIDFIVSVSERGFIIADEEGEREVVDFTPGLEAFGATGGVSGSAVLVRRNDELVICGVVYEGGPGADTTFFCAHADFIRANGTLDHTRIPP